MATRLRYVDGLYLAVQHQNGAKWAGSPLVLFWGSFVVVSVSVVLLDLRGVDGVTMFVAADGWWEISLTSSHPIPGPVPLLFLHSLASGYHVLLQCGFSGSSVFLKQHNNSRLGRVGGSNTTNWDWAGCRSVNNIHRYVQT